jgi:chemotaxis signal transduction protein
MNNKQLTINKSTADIISLASNSSLKILVFAIGKLTVALPVAWIQKVTKHSELHGSGLSHVNLTHLGESEITIVDLHQKLFKVSASDGGSQGYFIITKDNIIGESLGIIVTEMPTLMEVPLSSVRALPQSYRHADTLEIASHVAVIPQENQTALTIFILDLERLI